MTDVAKAAGVSQTTVSFVINNVRTVTISEETRQRVLETAQKLGYLPGSALPTPSINETCSIGFISDEIGISSYGGESLKGAQEAAWAAGNMLFLVNTEGIREMEEAALASMCDRKVDGIILATMIRREIQIPKIRCPLPMVTMNAYCADGLVSAFTTDEIWGGAAAARHLLRAGHRRIGFINGEMWMDAARERLAGYKKALAEYKIAYDEKIVCSGNWRPDSGYEHARLLLRQENRPTAIFCGNDLIAIGVYEAAKELNLSIPHDLSIFGYDDQEIASYMHPPLTTIRLPYYDMGYQAVNHLLGMINGQVREKPVHIKMLGAIVQRESVSNLPI